MRQYRYLPHTADMRFRAYGDGFGEALENAALALLNAMLDLDRVAKSRGRLVKVPIRETAYTQQELVWFTLQDILSRIDARKLNAYEFRISGIQMKGKKLHLAGTLMCKRSGEDNALLSVKAVTPNDLFVRNHGGRCTIQVVVDV